MTSDSYETICSVVVQSSWGKGDSFFHFAFTINGSEPVDLLERTAAEKTSSVYCEVCAGAKIIQGWGGNRHISPRSSLTGCSLVASV